MKSITTKLANNERKAVVDSLRRFRDDPRRFWQVVNDLWAGPSNTTPIRLVDDDGLDVPARLTADYINNYYTMVGIQLAEAFD